MDKEETFDKILTENDDRIRRICRYYNSEVEEQKDMYQEILVNVWRSLDGFRGDSAINTWVYRVAINTALSYTGKAFRKMKLIVNTDMENMQVLIEDNETEEKLKQEAHFTQLQNELNALSVIDKALISLVLEGLSMREIAEVIGITESNVRVKIHRIKDRLRTKFSGGAHEE